MPFKPLERHVQLNSAKSVTVQAVGEFAYKDTLARTPEGMFLAQLVPEPDNPYDPNAISVRYNGDVIAYIPADRTSKYWQDNPLSGVIFAAVLIIIISLVFLATL